MSDYKDNPPKISTTVLFFGFPAFVLLPGIVASYALAHYVYPAFWGYVALTFVVAYIWRRHLIKRDCITLRFPNGGDTMIGLVLVKGLSSEVLEQISAAINNYRVITIHSPKNMMLRAALAETIYRKGGFCKFRDANRFYISSEPRKESDPAVS